MSRMSKSQSSILLAASAITSGSWPKICSATGASEGRVLASSAVLQLPKVTAFALIISMTESPAPCSLQSSRNGRSDTPAIGASTVRFGMVTFPICQRIVIRHPPGYFPCGNRRRSPDAGLYPQSLRSAGSPPVQARLPPAALRGPYAENAP